MKTEAEKIAAALSVVANSVLHGWTDTAAIQRILPNHYEVKESKQPNAIHCKSATGIRKGIDAEDEEHWSYIMQAFKKHFGERFLEVYHNTCFCHVDFTIYLKPRL